jgi:Mg/Co/Ni transporter MgtE
MTEGAYKVLSLLMAEHADKLVDLCLEHGTEQTADLLKNLDDGSAARLLERVPPWFGGMAISHLDNASIAEMLSHLEASTSARLLRSLSTDRRHAVLNILDPRQATNVASFAAVDESKVGSAVRSSAMSVKEGTPVSTALDLVRKHPDKVMDYLYVVNQNSKLTGVLPIKRLLLGDAKQRVENLATANPDYLRIDDSLAQAGTHRRWIRARVMPVVDRLGNFAGVIAETDLPATRKSEMALREASQAIAETFEVGLMGLLRLLSSSGEGRS